MEREHYIAPGGCLAYEMHPERHAFRLWMRTSSQEAWFRPNVDDRQFYAKEEYNRAEYVLGALGWTLTMVIGGRILS